MKLGRAIDTFFAIGTTVAVLLLIYGLYRLIEALR